MSISICATASSVSEKTANEPIVGRGALLVDVETEILERREVLVGKIVWTENNFTSSKCRLKRKLHSNLKPVSFIFKNYQRIDMHLIIY